MSLVERSGEEIARFIDRRRFLKRAATVVFSIATASVINLDQVLTTNASSYCPYYPNIYPSCNCNPPGQKYCLNYDPSYCIGHTCAGKCVPLLNDWSGSGCWCTEICEDGCNEAYWVCCDCACNKGSLHCGCSQLYYYGSKRDC